jgi:uncharacterized membrane protein
LASLSVSKAPFRKLRIASIAIHSPHFDAHRKFCTALGKQRTEYSQKHAIILSMKTFTIIVSLFTAIAVSCCKDSTSNKGNPVDFITQIKPLLEKNCLSCHHSEVLAGELNLESRQMAFGKSEQGTFIVPGEPDLSLIYTATAALHGKQEDMMPPGGIQLTTKDRDLLHQWILEGAYWPEGEEGVLTPLKSHKGEA